MTLLDVVAKSIQDQFYKSEDSRFGVKEARAAIHATIEWLKEYEDKNELSFMFPAIDVLEEQLKD